MTVVEDSSENLPAPEELLSPGQQLAQARESAGLSQQQVAQALHMTVTKVRALEADDYKRLNVHTFVRGYLRAYALYLKLDPAVVLAAYEQQVAARGLITNPNDLTTKVKDPGRKTWGFIAGLVVVLALLLLISVWFFGNRIPSPAATATLPAQTPAAPVFPPDTMEQAERTTERADISDSADASDDEQDAATEDQAEAGAELTSAEQNARGATAQQAALDVLEVAFSAECWLEVSDAQGDVLATDLQRPGSQVVLRGKAPFQVKLGDAAAASITLNGVAVEITPPEDNRVVTVNVGE